MSIRALLAALLVGTMVLGFGFVIGSMTILRDQVLTLFPPLPDPSLNDALHFLLYEQAGALFLCSGILLCLLFWILGSAIARPLRRIVNAVDAFTTRGERISFNDVGFMPKELHALASAFSNFMDKVEESHQHDMEVSRVKSDFISTAAHQLRTPLTGIRWALEALEKEPLSESQKALVKSAVDKSHDLVSIVGTLLDISSIESGKYKYQFAPTDMEALIAEIVTDFAPLAAEHKVALFYAKSGYRLPIIQVDRERIKWVLNNLVENAIRYTPEGGTIRVSDEQATGRVLVHVHDTGIGINPADRANIFERFYRAGNAIAKENQGNGLGLYIARTIATDHGGDLAFTSNDGETGTTFTLSLPISAYPPTR